jgi:hypothetical protein
MDKDAILRSIDELDQKLRELRNHVLADDSPAEEAVTVSERQGEWKRSDLEGLYPLIERLPGALALLDVTAEHAPHAVTYQEVLHRSGLSDQEQRNDHTRLSWATKRLFFPGGKRWPLDWQQAANGEMRYWMPAKVARWWQDIHRRERPDAAA